VADDLKVKVTLQGEDKLSPSANSAAKSLDKVSASADKVDGSSTKAHSSVNVLAQGLAGPVVAGAAAVAGGLAYASSKAAEFDKTLSAVAAVTGLDVRGAEMKALGDLALELGASTSFSATEAAEAIGELAKGGVSAADIMAGAAKATLDLAAASGEKAAPAAALAANAMSLFNIEGARTAEVADAVAGFANATTGSMNDFKFALASSGAAAKLAGQDFDQTAVALALMGKAGILGSDAGTSLKTMLLNLVPTTKAQTAMFQELGLATNEVHNNFLNADGSFKDLREIAGELNRVTADLSESQRSLALETLFGSDAIRAAAILAQAGAEGFDEMSTAVLGTVTAAEVAVVMTDNLAGSTDAMNGSVESAAIMLGRELNPAIREVTDGLGKFTKDQVIPFIQEYGPGFGRQLTETVKFLGMVADALAPLVGPIGTAFRAMMDTWGQGLDLLIATIFNTVVAMANLKNAVGEAFDGLVTTVSTALNNAAAAISGMAGTFRDRAMELGVAIVSGIVSGINPGPIVARLQGLASEALAGAKAAIEARSPSKLFAREVGLPIALGIVAGIQEGESAVVAASESLVMRGFRGAVDRLGEMAPAVNTSAGSLVMRGFRGAVDRLGIVGPGEGSYFTGGIRALEGATTATIALTKSTADLQNMLRAMPGAISAARYEDLDKRARAAATGNQTLLTSTADLQNALRGMPGAITAARYDELTKSALEAASAVKQVNAAVGQGYGAGTGGGGTGGTGPGNAHTPLIMPQIGISAMAKGGLVTTPTLALIGEAGPEMVVPMAGGSGGEIIDYDKLAAAIAKVRIDLDGDNLNRNNRERDRRYAQSNLERGVGALV